MATFILAATGLRRVTRRSNQWNELISGGHVPIGSLTAPIITPRRKRGRSTARSTEAENGPLTATKYTTKEDEKKEEGEGMSNMSAAAAAPPRDTQTRQSE